MRGTDTKTRGAATNWDLTEDSNVRNVVRKAARSIADMNKGVIEEEDLYQDGLILVAVTPHLAQRAIDGDYGLLYTRVRTEFMQKFVEKMERSGELQSRKYKHVTFDDAEAEQEPYMAFDTGSGDYTDEAIRLLLPAVWDESYAYGLPQRDDAPEEGMPRAAGNKARGNSHYAYIADIKTGWQSTPLTLLERRSLLMFFGLGWEHKDIAAHEGIQDRSTITRRIDTAVKKITARLNGAAIEEV